MKKNVSIEICQNDFIPGFGGYLEDSVHHGPALVMINICDLVSVVQAKVVPVEDVPYVVAETIMHEVIHALEDWAGVEFSEDRVEELLSKYRELKVIGEHGERPPA